MPLHVSIRRHAERPEGMAGLNVPITPKGRKEALRLGQILKARNPWVKFYGTEFKRSQETAEEMRKGHGSHYTIRPRWSPFVRPGSVAYEKTLNELGEEVIQAWLEGKLDFKHIYSPHEVAVFAVKALRLAPKGSKKLGGKSLRLEAIAHDTTVLALFRELTGKDLPAWDARQRVNFLESLELEFDHQKIILQSRGQKWDVTEKFRQLSEEAKQVK